MLHSAFGKRPLHLLMGRRLSCWTFASKTRRRYAAFGIMALHGPGRSLPRNASIDSHAKRDLDAASILLLVLRPVCSNRLGSRFESKRGALCSDRSGSICNKTHCFNATRRCNALTELGARAAEFYPPWPLSRNT